MTNGQTLFNNLLNFIKDENQNHIRKFIANSNLPN